MKPTTLLAVGPKASRLESLFDLSCNHPGGHPKVAAGVDEEGNFISGQASAYPPLACAFFVIALCTEANVTAKEVINSPAALPFVVAVARETVVNELAASAFITSMQCGSCDEEPEPNKVEPPLPDGDGDAGEVRNLEQQTVPNHVAWKAAPEAMPAEWEETGDVVGEAYHAARRAELAYISRRRTEPEDPELLAGRALPEPVRMPEEPEKPRWVAASRPKGAPQGRIHISMLYLPGVWDDIEKWIKKLSPMCLTTKLAVRQYGQDQMPAWARGIIWDTSNPEDCVPMVPYSEADPPVQEVNGTFFHDWGELLDHPDEDMVAQVTKTGVEGRSQCEMTTVLVGHHGGLRHNPEPVVEIVGHDSHEDRKWSTTGSWHPQTVPFRLVPKNVVSQHKWKMVDGVLTKVVKWRVTTDDSWAPPGLTSRNDGMDKDEWPDTDLPHVRNLAEAVAIVKSIAKRMGIRAREAAYERIALWALDLSDAYR